MWLATHTSGCSHLQPEEEKPEPEEVKAEPEAAAPAPAAAEAPPAAAAAEGAEAAAGPPSEMGTSSGVPQRNPMDLLKVRPLWTVCECWPWTRLQTLMPITNCKYNRSG